MAVGVGRVAKSDPGRGRKAGGLFLSQLVVAAVSLPVSVLLARSLGPAGVGDYQFLNRAALIFVSVACLGYPHALAWAASNSSDSATDRTLVRVVFRVSLLGGGLGLAVALVIANSGFHPGGSSAWVIYAFFPIVNLLSANMVNLLRGKLMIGSIASIRLSQALLWLAGCVAVSLTVGLTVPAAAAVMVGSQLVGVLVAFASLRRRGMLVGERAAIDLQALRRFSNKVFPGLAIRDVNVYLDQLVIGVTLASRDLGVYAVAVSLTAALGLLSGPIINTIQPVVQGAGTEAVRTCCRALAATLLVVGVPALLLGVSAPWAVPLLYGENFRAAVVLVQLLTAAATIDALNSCVHGCLLGLERPGLSSMSTASGLLVMVICLAVFLPVFGVKGAAIASILSYATVLSWMCVSLARSLSIRLPRLIWMTVCEIPRVAKAMVVFLHSFPKEHLLRGARLEGE